MRILNIYGQPSHHFEARIVGNREGLEALRNAIDNALIIDSHAKAPDDNEPLFASDGEGYEILIDRHDDEWGINAPKDSFWNKPESDPEYVNYK